MSSAPHRRTLSPAVFAVTLGLAAALALGVPGGPCSAIAKDKVEDRGKQQTASDSLSAKKGEKPFAETTKESEKSVGFFTVFRSKIFEAV